MVYRYTWVASLPPPSGPLAPETVIRTSPYYNSTGSFHSSPFLNLSLNFLHSPLNDSGTVFKLLRETRTCFSRGALLPGCYYSHSQTHLFITKAGKNKHQNITNRCASSCYSSSFFFFFFTPKMSRTSRLFVKRGRDNSFVCSFLWFADS